LYNVVPGPDFASTKLLAWHTICNRWWLPAEFYLISD